MAKYRRNDPCPCGSGKKYKRCCSLKHEVQRGESARMARLQAEDEKERQKDLFRRYRDELIVSKDLAERSNAVADMIRNDRLDQAEIEAKRLIEDFPDATDGLERLGWVYEKQNNTALATKYYSKAIALLTPHAYENKDHINWLENLINNLNPPTSD